MESTATPTAEPVAGLSTEQVLPDLAYLRTGIVNVYFAGEPGAGDREWALVDTEMYGSAGAIRRAAEERYGPGSRPAAIVLTHGHFDHVGAVRELAAEWQVPVYAHPLELPYVTGASAYPPPDPLVGGGAMAAMSWMYPNGPIDLGGHARALPEDGSVPGMPGWRWIHTPGHAPGHVSLFRDADRALIAGDAFITVKQESLFAVLLQEPELHGPPAYFTPDWESAHRSVERLQALEPELAATGHGVPLRGPEMRERLRWLAANFDRVAVPPSGRYVGRPARWDERGTVSVPPPRVSPATVGLALAGAGLILGLAARRVGRRR